MYAKPALKRAYTANRLLPCVARISFLGLNDSGYDGCAFYTLNYFSVARILATMRDSVHISDAVLSLEFTYRYPAITTKREVLNFMY